MEWGKDEGYVSGADRVGFFRLPCVAWKRICVKGMETCGRWCPEQDP